MEIKKNADEEDYDQFLNEYSLAGLVKKYSDYIRFPIKMEREKHRPVENKEGDDQDKH
jgi:molecular chaperone HtpG